MPAHATKVRIEDSKRKVLVVKDLKFDGEHEPSSLPSTIANLRTEEFTLVGAQVSMLDHRSRMIKIESQTLGFSPTKMSSKKIS